MASKQLSAMTYDQVEQTWISAGGNPQAASMAAAVADASSGLNPSAEYTNPDGSMGVGLWLIDKKGMPPGSIDPIANARAAIQQSNNGTDWKQWCVAWSDNACGQSGGSYLGDGSNALGSLAQRAEPGNYSVIGSTPTGTGTPANTASTTVPTAPGGKSNTLLLVGGILVVSVGLFFLMRRQRQGGSTQTTPTVAAEEI